MRYLLLRLKRFCGFITGFVFFISGILKLMDPVGASLVMKEYFDFLHVAFMKPVSMAAGIFFAFAETMIGTGLITGVWRRITAPVAICFQGFFTILTLLLVIFNPEMDCGCFGEAVHLTHMETFIKNLALMVLLLTYYIPSRHLGETKRRKYVSFGLVMASVTAFTVYSLIHLPLNDYTDYHPGVSMKGDKYTGDTYKSAFTYEKNGRQEIFTIDNLPDSTWTFVSTETTIVNDDVSSVSLSFHDGDGNYADSLAFQDKVMIVSLYDTDISERKKSKIIDFIRESESAGFSTILLSASPVSFPEGISHYIADYKALITLNRSNGGVTYLDDGIIIRKWSMKSQPTLKELEKLGKEDVTETLIGNSRNSLAFQGFMLYVFAVMLLL